jgi:hypothetical protein
MGKGVEVQLVGRMAGRCIVSDELLAGFPGPNQPNGNEGGSSTGAHLPGQTRGRKTDRHPSSPAFTFLHYRTTTPAAPALDTAEATLLRKGFSLFVMSYELQL